jgi:hypothetical protein
MKPLTIISLRNHVFIETWRLKTVAIDMLKV